jgi:uncharacterized phage protein gp47/JayE
VATYPLSTLGCTITPNGITSPALEDIINSLIASAQTIFGADIYLAVSTQDYQDIGIRAQAQYDTNMAIIAAYNSFSPTSATGAALSSNVAINGIQRQPSTNSTTVVAIDGVPGTTIPANFNQVMDPNQNIWTIPPGTVIPGSGVIAVTATCTVPGPITAAPGTWSIFTQVIGWQSVTNTTTATPGAAVETDAEIRDTQINATSLPSQTRLTAIAAAIAEVSGVTRSQIYENQTASTDSNGIPSHSIAVVVAGGDAQTIANTIEAKKSEGTGTCTGVSGATTETVTDPAGLLVQISFFPLVSVPIFVGVTITPLAGYVASTGDALIAAIVDFLNASPIGGVNGPGGYVYLNQLLGVASLQNSALGDTFVITLFKIGLSAITLGTSDIAITFKQAATCVTGNVSLVVT